MGAGDRFPGRLRISGGNLFRRLMIPLRKVSESAFGRCCRWLTTWPQGRTRSKRLAMNAPLLPTQTGSIALARRADALARPLPRPWRDLSETGKAQLASVVADIVKRMAASAAEADSDVGDSNR